MSTTAATPSTPDHARSGAARSARSLTFVFLPQVPIRDSWRGPWLRLDVRML